MNGPSRPQNGFLAQWILDQFEPGYRGWAIDVGASDGVYINTTWALEKIHRWTVLSVEANSDFGPALKQERAWVEMCACADESAESADFTINTVSPEAFSALHITDHECLRRDQSRKEWSTVKVPVKTVDELLAKWEFPRLDALCVDVEGGELEVLKGCDLAKWKPKVIVSEAWDSGHEYRYLNKFGYKLVARQVHNDCYILDIR